MVLDTLPSVSHIAKQLKGLLGTTVIAKDCPPGLLHGNPQVPTFTGMYATDRGEVSVVAICSLPLAAATGACLGLIPGAQAEEWITTGKVNPNGMENFNEILNVLAGVFNETRPNRHVRLQTILQPGQMPAKPDIRALVGGRGPSVDMIIEIERYPTGKLTLRSR